MLIDFTKINNKIRKNQDFSSFIQKITLNFTIKKILKN